jgi:hypothetical protein
MLILFLASLEVSKLAEVEWNDRALDNLVLGKAEKKLITALLSSKQRQGHQMFDDFIQGKGKAGFQNIFVLKNT